MSDAGWPRPFRDYVPPTTRGRFQQGETYRLPDLWILEDNDWLNFQIPRSQDCFYERICAVCGEAMHGVIIMPKMAKTKVSDRQTSGPGCHPRCAATALKLCPHLQGYAEFDFAAYRYDGPGIGTVHDPEYEPYEGGITTVDPRAVAITLHEVKLMAKDNPLGMLT